MPRNAMAHKTKYTYISVIYQKSEDRWSRMSGTPCSSLGMMSAMWCGNIDGNVTMMCHHVPSRPCLMILIGLLSTAEIRYCRLPNVY